MESDSNKIKKYVLLNKIMIVSVLFVIMISIIIAGQVLSFDRKVIVINDNGNLIFTKTLNTTVGEVLNINGIKLTDKDYISAPLQENLLTKNEYYINIRRAVPVLIDIDGKSEKIMTYHSKVGDMLKNEGITLATTDRMEGAELGQEVFNGMKFKVVRVREEVVTEEETLAYKVERRKNENMIQGIERTVRHGSEGIKEKSYKVVKEDGVQVAKQLISESLIASPVAKIVEFGTILTIKTSRGSTLMYDKVLDMRATAYTSSYEDTGKHPGHPQFGITYTGKRARVGIIATDPKVIPMGTRLYVEVPGSAPDYGECIAGDIGSAIKKDKIDLYFDGKDTVKKWGIRPVKVYFLR